MAATPNEVAAITANTEAINQILAEAQNIDDHSEMVVLNSLAFVLVQLGAATPEKLQLQKIINDAVSTATAVERFDASVGAVDATYTTIKAAYDAGKRNLLYINDSTETADITITQDLLVHVMPDVTADFAGFNITSGADNTTLVKEGEGEIKYTSTVASKVFFNQDTFVDNKFIFKSGVFRNQSSEDDCLLTNADYQDIQNCAIYINDQVGNGIFFKKDSNLAKNIEIIGGGTGCYRVIQIQLGTIQKCTISGIVSSTGDEYVIENPLGFKGAILKNIAFTTELVPKIGIGDATLNDLSCISPYKVNIKLTSDDGSFHNISARGGTFETNFRKDFIITGNSIIEYVGDDFTWLGTLNNVIFSKAAGVDMTILGEKMSLVDCKRNSAGNVIIDTKNSTITRQILDDGVLSVYKDKNTLNNCQSNSLIVGATLADPTLPPPTEVTGDRYYLDPSIVGAVHGDWDGAAKGTTPEFDTITPSTWDGDFTPVDTTLSGNRTSSGGITDNVTDTKEILTGLI